MARELLSQGASKSIYRDGDKILKVFAKGFDKSEVFHEAFINTRVENIDGINIPKILGVYFEDGQWIIEKEYVEGKTLKQLMDENPAKMDEYIGKMVDLQMSVFSKKAPLLQKLKDKLTYQINGLNTIDSSTRYELLTRLESMPKHFKLVHGDFRPSNIIVKDDGTMYLIDWVHAAQGNASADVARTYTVLYLYDKDVAEKYYADFCSKTNTDKTYVHKWLPIIAAANLTKKRPEEKEILENWLNVADLM
ncbi:phosphotransferase [Oribacterium sp. P6A1]|uniref:phosphotransferase n=1 Tax=Oribacterium sp. P6A1 TaxID=1410612 RepID=UPI000562250A|nr:phosphotransferase [Oribacterium sp. P6A1]